ncbi:carbohydrate ABC transporter permease [Paenibacillus sp. GCM10027626]|uniref:carbohydrate ABC transporter permease n=1 Tax=Paenibacillus sp. GCM10027626 TaxID=3273411 RepID=UPI00363DBEB4
MKRKDRKARWLYIWKEYGTGYLFMLPWLLGFAVFMAFPLGWSLYLSFNKVTLTGEGFHYVRVGFGNFADALLKDNEYPAELFAFFIQVILMIPIIVIFALFVSLFLNQRFVGRFLYRSIFFLPVIFATGQVLLELFRQGAGEMPFLKQYGIDQLLYPYVGKQLAEPIQSVLGSIVLILWYSGVQILIFIAAFQTVPRSVYEALHIDGATPWESFWKITLPSIMPFIALNTLYTVVDLFTFPSNPVMRQISANMFKMDTGYGYASALAWLYFALVLLLLGGCMRFIGRMQSNAFKGGG